MDKKIAILINKYQENCFTSGGEKVNYFLIQALYEIGFDIDLYCNETVVEKSERLKNIYIKQKSEFYKRKNEYLFSMSENFSEKTDFLYIHENSRAYRENHTKTILEKILRTIISPKRSKGIQNTLVFQSCIIDEAKKCLCPSTFIQSDLLESFDIPLNKTHILPPPIEFDEVADKAVSHKIFTFGLSARGFDNKGGYFVILAAMLLKLFNQNFKIVIIYPFSNSAKKFKKVLQILGMGKNIEFIDYCKNMSDFYDRIDCLIMASKREAFGLVAAEAMHRGIPVIINTQCGIKDFIVNDKNGFIYDFKRPVLNLFKTMLMVLNQKDNIEQIKTNGAKTIKKLSYENFKAKLKSIIDDYLTKF